MTDISPPAINITMTFGNHLPVANWTLSLNCDRCSNRITNSRKRMPVDPATFCDQCHEETGL